MNKHVLLIVLIVAALSLLGACSSTPEVQRVAAETQVDLSGYWNDSDVRIVCKSLIEDCITSPRVAQAIGRVQGRKPTVIVGTFKNESSEPIDTTVISKNMEIEIFNSGILNFVAGGSTREELRAEKLDQNQGDTSEETAARPGQEIGADFMLTGSVKTVVDKAGNQTVRTYFVSAELTGIETNERIWMGQNNEIKKLIRQPRSRL